MQWGFIVLTRFYSPSDSLPLAARSAAGLVHSATSVMPGFSAVGGPCPSAEGGALSDPAFSRPQVPGAVEIDAHALRLRRLKKNVITTARLHQQEVAGTPTKGAMVTLTYRPEDDWDPKQITAYIKRVREWYKRKTSLPLRYVWVLELTKAGKPHYHCLFWLRKGVTMPKADKRGWWPHGWTNTEWARRPVGYLAKYASKGTAEKMPPKGARLYGVGGLSLSSRLERAWWNLPTYVRGWGTPLDRWRRALGGGWLRKGAGDLDPTAGEWRDSAFSVIFLGGRVFAVPKIPPNAE